jgi:glycerate 2-kinase
LDLRILSTDIRIACDVTNPLCGPKGASAVYGPQKGATRDMVEILDNNLNHYADLVEKSTGKQVKDIPGAGAAGGLGAGLLAFLNAKLQPGVEIVLAAANMDVLLQDADLVITGEGQTDRQTLFGKAPTGVAEVARRHGVPIVCISGSLALGAEELYNLGFAGLFSITEGPISLDEAMNEAPQLLERAAERVIRLYLTGRKRG